MLHIYLVPALAKGCGHLLREGSDLYRKKPRSTSHSAVGGHCYMLPTDVTAVGSKVKVTTSHSAMGSFQNDVVT